MGFETIRENDIEKRVGEILKNELNPGRVILFGSRTKGNADRFADFDFAVDSPKPSLEKLRKIKDKIEEVSGLYKIDIVFLPEVEEEFTNIIVNSGRVVYER